MIRILEKKRLVHMQRVSASLVVQRAFRLLRAGGQIRRQAMRDQLMLKQSKAAIAGDGVSGPRVLVRSLSHAVTFGAFASRTAVEQVVSDARSKTLQRGVAQAIRNFRKYRIMQEEASVSNLKVVSSKLVRYRLSTPGDLWRMAFP